MDQLTPEQLGYIVFILLCLLISSIFSAIESSFISVNRLRIKSLIEKGDKRAQAVKHAFENHDKLFSAVIVTSNMANVAGASAGTVLGIELLNEEYGPLVATIVMTLLVVIFGELAPKTFAVTHAEKVSLALARPLDQFIRLITPVVWVFNTISNTIIRIFVGKHKHVSPYVTEDEIKALISMGSEEGTLEEEEREMLHKVFEFRDKTVSEAMIPRTNVVAILESATITDALKLVSECGNSRFPVIKDNIDNVTGILYIKDIMIKMAQHEIDTAQTIDQFQRDAYYVPESKMIRELLEEMQLNKFQIAVIIDEYGGTAGLITLEDLMEVIVGSLQDEFEKEGSKREVEMVDENTYVISGQTSIDEIAELLNVEFDTEDFNTVGGFLFGLFGRLPRVGEQILFQNIRFVVLEMEDKKIATIKISKL